MIWIFKFFPQWLWGVLLITGCFSYFLGFSPLAKPYALLLKIAGLATIAVAIFILGMLYSDNTWRAEAAELQAKVTAIVAESKVANETIKKKVVIKTQIVKTRGQDIITYVDREVVKNDQTCTISPEFVQAHNRAAETTK